MSETESIFIRPIDFGRDTPDLNAFLNDRNAAAIELLQPAVADGDAFVLVAESEDAVVGWAVVRTAYRADTGWQPGGSTAFFVSDANAYLEYFHVSETFRGRGTGTELLQASHQEAVRRRKSRLWLHTGEENAGAHRLYGRNGWRHQETIHPSWADGRATRIYTKELS